MTVLCDFTQIIGDTPVTIGDPKPVWEQTFNTGGRESGSTGFLIFNVRGLTYTNVDVNVKLNNRVIGKIARYGGLNDADKNENAKYWYTQMVAFNGSDLNNGNNEVQIEAVGFPGSTDTNRFDDFEIKDMMCFFHQSA
ncbi:hypothetical protein [Calothrix sp. UHCC 0171]|uniref:hypothetical protein n=1 Tax=Calothrix sp. UHCC 0171 TaxID=3110245 RepID=UPI002B1F761A|nr:hypothetical protein [Calothrix sp. UHCC 0171]MEA5574351.1 hypothetical protein [Calothrix sp. UHCC 0171]